MVFLFEQEAAYEVLTCDWSSDVCSSDLTKATTGGTQSGIAGYETHYLHDTVI